MGVISYSWWSRNRTFNGCRYNVVKGITVSSVEKPKAWNSTVTKPRAEEIRHSQKDVNNYVHHKKTFSVVINVLSFSCNSI